MNPSHAGEDAIAPPAHLTAAWRVALAASLLAAMPTQAECAPQLFPASGLEWDDSLDERITSIERTITRWAAEPDWPSPPPEWTRSLAEERASAEADSTASGAVAPGVMTLFSMVLSAGALGVLLVNRPERGRAIGRTNETHEAHRRLVWCVVLLVVLNVFDLACTAQALPTGGFLEANPVAHSLTRDVPLLVACKLAIIATCAASLLAFWRYRIAQAASWWASTVYTVLAIRWAVYHSMYLGCPLRVMR
jgi:hypothetical protein